ncbi:tetratricopeptide repeat protein [Kitasatospora sp. NPDC092948]|uniref:tetratricopeptide repeat protein n=1 Tax=Kitasatospora sp. NPDC092948 TaxID=3364088 RepID=UPI0037FE78CD
MTTDIWSWVQDTHRQLAESGQHRLAGALVEIAGHAVEGRNEQLDAMYPEALASARALGLPWVEVFLRHWRLQNLLNKRYQGEAAMSEAVSLLEFAHREETASCPQSVCAVQDFTICHANIDGPGYVPERLAVLEETLQRVEPARACFDCLSREYADTLEDDGRPADALTHLDRAQTRILAAGEQVSLSFAHSRASALHRLGRYQDALNAYDTAEHAYVAAGNRLDDDDRRKLAVGRALQLAALGRTDLALELLPDAEEADRYPDIRHRWTSAVELLTAAGEFPNDAELGARLAGWAGELDTAGSHRPCLILVLAAGRLALARGAREVARTLARTGERKLGQLRRTDGVAEQVAALRAAAAALPHRELPVPADKLPKWLAEHRPEPEAGADLLAAALATDAAPDTVLVLNLAGALGALGHARAVTELLWEQLELDPGNDHLTGMLGELLIDAEDGDGIDRLAARLSADPADAHWLRARWAAAQSRWAEVGEQCAAVLAHEPDALNTRRLAAAAATRRGDHAEAQRLYQDLLEHALDPAEAGEDEQHRTVQTPDLWHLITAATANRDWPAVRATGARLGIEFDADSGPVDEEWQLIEVRAPRHNGTTVDLPAVRTGPATARVLPVLGDDHDLNHGDVVVFAPALLNDHPEPGEEEDWHPVFEHLTLLDPAGYTTYWIDGCCPDDDTWYALRDALQEAGYAVWAYSGDQYRITDPHHEGETLPGIYAALGVPPTATAKDADTLLAELTAAWPHPLAWPDLAEAAGTDLARHRKIIDDYDL